MRRSRRREARTQCRGIAGASAHRAAPPIAGFASFATIADRHLRHGHRTMQLPGPGYTVMLRSTAVEHVNAHQLSEAVVVWTGFGETAWPARDKNAS